MNVKWTGVPTPKVVPVGLRAGEAETLRTELREKIMAKFNKVVDTFRDKGSAAALAVLLQLREADFPEVTEKYGEAKGVVATVVIGRFLADLSGLVQLLVIADGVFNPALRRIIADIESSDVFGNPRTLLARDLIAKLRTDTPSAIASERGQGSEFEAFVAAAFNIMRPPVDTFVELIKGMADTDDRKNATIQHVDKLRGYFASYAIELAVAITVPLDIGKNSRPRDTRIHRSKIFVGMNLRELVDMYLEAADETQSIL